MTAVCIEVIKIIFYTFTFTFSVKKKEQLGTRLKKKKKHPSVLILQLLANSNDSLVKFFAFPDVRWSRIMS